jgi:hypothetical protein
MAQICPYQIQVSCTKMGSKLNPLQTLIHGEGHTLSTLNTENECFTPQQARHKSDNSQRQLVFEHHITQYVYENIIVRPLISRKAAAIICFFISNDVEISVVNIARQSRVPFLFLKPYWVGDNMQFFSAQKSKRVHIIFSMSFLPQASKLIGLYGPDVI